MKNTTGCCSLRNEITTRSSFHECDMSLVNSRARLCSTLTTGGVMSKIIKTFQVAVATTFSCFRYSNRFWQNVLIFDWFIYVLLSFHSGWELSNFYMLQQRLCLTFTFLLLFFYLEIWKLQICFLLIARINLHTQTFTTRTQ